MSIKKFRGKAGVVFWPTCDCCGFKLAPETCWQDARTAMAEAGWMIRRGSDGWEHLCTVCKDDGEEAEA